MAKTAGGLIGITRIESAMYRWGFTFNERSRLADDTRRMFGLLNDGELYDELSHKESLPVMIKRDNKDVGKLVCQFERYSVFYPTNRNEFVGLTTGDVAKEVKVY